MYKKLQLKLHLFVHAARNTVSLATTSLDTYILLPSSRRKETARTSLVWIKNIKLRHSVRGRRGEIESGLWKNFSTVKCANL